MIVEFTGGRCSTSQWRKTCSGSWLFSFQFWNNYFQVGLLGLQMLWTRDSEITLSKAKIEKKVNSYHAFQKLGYLFSFILETIGTFLYIFRRVMYLEVLYHQQDKYIEQILSKLLCPPVTSFFVVRYALECYQHVDLNFIRGSQCQFSSSVFRFSLPL